MLKNLKRIIEYCQTINDGLPIPAPHIVADEMQGTTVLNNPSFTGLQIIISMPLAKLSGDCDGMNGPHTFIIYALEKAKEVTATQCNVVEQYLTMVDMLNTILEKFSEDIGSQGSLGACPLLADMDLIEIEVLPSAGMFGGWNGYSAAVTLK
ncbi:MAG: hypothetical protein RRY23_00145 [Alistipes sp.]